MTAASWHYWLIEGGHDVLPLPVEGMEVFTSLDEAREVARGLYRPIDIHRTPADGGIMKYVERIESAKATPEPVSLKIDIPQAKALAASDSAAGGEPSTERDIADRWANQVGDSHLRSLRWTPTGSTHLVEVLDEKGRVIQSGMGDDPQDAYLDLWDEMKPPD